MPSVLKRHRFGAFLCVGVLGFVLQIAALAALTLVAGWRWLPATIASVELAVLHNFYWHRRWTWRDRPAISSGGLLMRFHLSNGVASLVGNAGLMALLVEIGKLPPIVANVIAVAMISLANFAMADRWVFGNRGPAKLRHQNSGTELRYRTPATNSDSRHGGDGGNGNGGNGGNCFTQRNGATEKTTEKNFLLCSSLFLSCLCVNSVLSVPSVPVPQSPKRTPVPNSGMPVAPSHDVRRCAPRKPLI